MFEAYIKVRNQTESICDPLTPEDCVPQIAVFASPAKWHLAHTSWFFEEIILKKHLKGYKEYDKNYGFLFNSYYQSVGERLLQANRGNLSRPSLEDVYAYRKHVNEAMEKLTKSNLTPQIKALIVLGMNHEQQHQELLYTDIKYLFGNNPIFPTYKEGFNAVNDSSPHQSFLKVEAGLYQVGHDSDGFHYDNEGKSHQVYLQEFEISTGLVSNQEYLAFISAGGYETFEYWLDDGWTWLQENQIQAPLYWHLIEGEWHYFTLAGLKKINPEAAVCHISFYEAEAFARWKGMRLPTEFEWEVASHKLNWGLRWEWTNSAYLPYPNFIPAAGAIGEYNGKFMVNQMVLRGASKVTSAGHSRNTYRNFFAPEHQWQFTGIRLVK